jgi:hypothetical protein
MSFNQFLFFGKDIKIEVTLGRLLELLLSFENTNNWYLFEKAYSVAFWQRRKVQEFGSCGRSHPYSRFQKCGTRSEWSCSAHINLDVIWSLIRLGCVPIVDLEIDLLNYVVHLYSALSGVASGLLLVWASFICDVGVGRQPCGKIGRSQSMPSRSGGFGHPSYGKFGLECHGKGTTGKMVRRVFWPKL